MTPRQNRHYLEDILGAIEATERFVAGMTFEALAEDEKTIRALERELEIIGEAVKKLPDTWTSSYPQISWRAVAGMRDRLIHHYWDTEVEILWQTIRESLPPLKQVIQTLIASHQSSQETHE